MKFPRIFAGAVVCLLLAANIALAEFVTTTNAVHPNGTAAQIDVPSYLHIRNTGGSDGSGLCVGTSIELAARWQNVREWDGYQAWLKQRPGGSYPEMTASDFKAFANAKGVKIPANIQHTGGDVEFLRLAAKTRRMISMTYAGYDPFYGQQPIAHMVSGVHLCDKLGAIVDNNEPGRWRWMNDEQLIARWLGRRDNGQPILIRTPSGFMELGGGWAVVWLGSPPPPIDKSRSDYLPEQSQVVHEEDGEVTPLPELSNEVRVFGNELLANPFLQNGINRDKLPPKLRYWVNGEEVTRKQAFSLVRGETLLDDTSKPFLSVVSDDKTLRDKLIKLLGPLADKLHVNVYTSDHWVVKERLKNTVTAQLANGNTVFKADKLDDATLLAAAKAALGIQEPPPVAPAPQPAPLPLPLNPADPKQIPWWALLLAAVVAWFLTKKAS